MKNNRRISLVVKVNLLMVALVLLTAVSLFVSSERSFQKAVFDLCAKQLLQAESGTKALEPYFPSFLHCLGIEELNAALVQIYAQMGLSPSQTLHATNEWLRTSNKTSMFFTVWFGILDLSTGVITAVNGGHEYPVLRCGGQPYDLLKDRHGLMVGVSARAKYTDYEIRLAPGDRLFLYTDGVPEAQTADAHMFGTERMLQALNADPDAPPERLLANVRAAVDSFIGGAKQFDDLTMLCLEYRGPRANPEAEGDAP